MQVISSLPTLLPKTSAYHNHRTRPKNGNASLVLSYSNKADAMPCVTGRGKLAHCFFPQTKFMYFVLVHMSAASNVRVRGFAESSRDVGVCSTGGEYHCLNTIGRFYNFMTFDYCTIYFALSSLPP